VVTAPEIFRRLEGIQSQLNDLFRKAWVDETARRESLEKIDDLIHGKIHDLGPEDIFSLSPNATERHPLRVALLRGSPVGLALCKYLALMTCAWPEWQRITMLPHAASLGKEIQPGGLLICEDGPPDCHLSAIELENASLISSTAFAQYQITLAEERALIESRDRTIGLVHHEISRGIATVKGMLESPECRIALATQALDRMELITRASFNLTTGEPDPMPVNDFVQFIQQDVEVLRRPRPMRPAPVVNATFYEDLGHVDSRLYVIVREVLRNAGNHITNCKELRLPHVPGTVALDVRIYANGVTLSCRSSPHHLPIDDPKLCFRENPEKPSMKGLGLIRQLAEQLGGEIDWIPKPTNGPEFLVGQTMHGGYSVCFTYTGPRLIEQRQ
jgi:hypothetical protein